MNTSKSQVAAMLALGMTNKQIGNSLGLSEKTVKAHCTNLYRDYEVKGRLQFALKYLQLQRLSAPQSSEPSE